MHAKAQHILHSLRHQSSEAISYDELSNQYPWYPTAWLGKYLEGGLSDDSLAKLGLTVHNPLQLQSMLSPAVYPQPMPEIEAIPEQEAPAEVAAPTENEEQANVPPTESETSEPSGMVQAALESVETVSEEPPALLANSGAAADTDDELLFQPYHTVDYFASQGIKVDAMLQATNRFDRQLMSFTQWLKTMKRLQQQDVSKPNDPRVDAQADASVAAKEVVTEAMAEVLEKQGKHDQAIDLYSKLTLLHPEKSVFFAARIENLKQLK
jgi:tetratricopeptide (TPR) repeat protein